MSATGSFPSVSTTGVSSGGTTNAYSIQMNTNLFATSLCAGATNPNSCRGWQQFVYDSSGYAVIQVWLVSYGTAACPSGWSALSGNCWKNSVSGPVPSVSVTDLSTVRLAGFVGANDTVVVNIGTTAYSLSAASVFGLDGLGAWNTVEFNVFGDCCFRAAIFDANTTMVVQVNVDNGTFSPPSAASGGTTGETSNLTLSPAWCPIGVDSAALQFLESNEAVLPPPPFCVSTSIIPSVFMP